MRLICCVLILVPALAETLIADEFTVQNDSLVDGGDAYIQAGFREGDIGAAVFDLPCGFYPIQINAVQIYWRSQDPLMQVLTHVYIYGAGGPDPGAPIYTGTGALMTAGYMLEFDSSQLGWVVNQGPFAVGVKYLGEVAGTLDDLSGHLTTDADGCQSGKNLIYDAPSGQWFDACSAGVSGDFVIRVVFESSGNGCYGDIDCDGDVDLPDYAEFQRCLSGAGTPAAQECLPLDCDADGDVDFDDFLSFELCVSGPEIGCDPGCVTCQLGPGGEPPHGGPRWELRELVIVVGIMILLTGLIFTYFWTTSARDVRSTQFSDAAQVTTDPEQFSIDQAIMQLQTWAYEDPPDLDALEAYNWYVAHHAFGSANQWYGTVKVNHWTTEEADGIIATHWLEQGQDRMAVHVRWVIGPDYSSQVLGLILFAEWQHAAFPWMNEGALQRDFRAFRERHGLEGLLPDWQHGYSEGEGVDDPG
jgi:hypothetical protein